MFRKRTKKVFPPGTFIPTPARIAAILQLCIAFTIILSNASYPFLGEIFSNKAQAYLYNDVMGNSAIEDEQNQARIKRNQERFESLSANEQMQIIEEYRVLQNHAQGSFFEKVGRSISILLTELPAFKLAWIIFSIAISIMLLMRIEGAQYAVWLLPIIVLAFAYDNYSNGISQKMTAEEKLFPREEEIVSDYLKKPLSKNINEQQKQLEEGWKLYLVEKWNKQNPSDDAHIFQSQVEEGEFKFNLARVKSLEKKDSSAIFRHKEHPLTLIIYFLWNLFFATIIWFKGRV